MPGKTTHTSFYLSHSLCESTLRTIRLFKCSKGDHHHCPPLRPNGMVWMGIGYSEREILRDFDRCLLNVEILRKILCLCVCYLSTPPPPFTHKPCVLSKTHPFPKTQVPTSKNQVVKCQCSRHRLIQNNLIEKF